VAVLADDGSDGDWTSGPHVPRVLGLDRAMGVASIAPAALREGLANGRMAVVDLDTSRNYARGHIPGAWFAVRSGLPHDLAKLATAGGPQQAIVLTSPDGTLARLAAADLAAASTAATGAMTPAPTLVLEGGTAAWAKAGLPIETGATHMASDPVDVVLSARERGVGREEAMREYLAWEIDLVNQMATDDDQRFQVVTA
jgi:rhodanese-related sulfurtransferase